jgi:F-type H+-transporting ATPase subunit gamma
MKAMAASNIGQYEKAVRALSDYYRTVELGLSVCFPKDLQKSPVTIEETSAARPVDVIVFGSDQGLVGRFNDVVADYAAEMLRPPTGKSRVWAVGERIHARLADGGLRLAGSFAVPNSVNAITSLVGQLLVALDPRREGAEATTLYLIYNRPSSGAAYAPVKERLLPLDDDWRQKLTALPWPTALLPEILGDVAATGRALLREYLFISLFRACSDSLASENTSRLAAMQRADKNIKELLVSLNTTFRSLRQSGIDEELFDVVSGFEALGQKRQ